MIVKESHLSADLSDYKGKITTFVVEGEILNENFGNGFYDEFELIKLPQQVDSYIERYSRRAGGMAKFYKNSQGANHGLESVRKGLKEWIKGK